MDRQFKPSLLVAEARDFSPRALLSLREHFQVQEADYLRLDLIANLAQVEFLWVRLRTKIDREVMCSGPNLKAIITNTTGLTHVDLPSASDRNIHVLSLKGETDFLKDIRATAEHSLGLTLALLRRVPSAFQDVLEGNWNRYPFKGREIYGATVGIVGYGRLGARVAEYMHQLGARVLATDIDATRSSSSSVKMVDLTSLLAESDIVSLHADYRNSNYRMFGLNEFSTMKQGAVFINTSRGQLVDEEALITCLKSGHLGGAALDVLDEEFEGAIGNCPLIEYARANSNLLITPHIGGNTFESIERTEDFLATKLITEYRQGAFL